VSWSSASRTLTSSPLARDRHSVRVAASPLRHSRIALTMEIYTLVPAKVTRDALKRLGDWLDNDERHGLGILGPQLLHT
jgi:hypothetical protein